MPLGFGLTGCVGGDLDAYLKPDAALGFHPHAGVAVSSESLAGLDLARGLLTQSDANHTLVVAKLDRLARSVPDARDIADELTVKGVKLSMNGSVYDPTDPIGKLLFTTLSMVAEFEADLIAARTREGMAIAKENGRLKGKKPKLSPTKEKHLAQLHAEGTHTVAELCELFDVTRSTVYRAIDRQKLTAVASGSGAAASTGIR